MGRWQLITGVAARIFLPNKDLILARIYCPVFHIYRSMFRTVTNTIILCIVSASLCCCIGCLWWLTAVLLHSAGSWPRGRRAQCYAQLSALLSRSQSNRIISAETSSSPQELHHPHPDTHSAWTTAQWLSSIHEMSIKGLVWIKINMLSSVTHSRAFQLAC